MANDGFALLEGPMGTGGWDDLYDIAYGASGVNYKQASARARNDLQRSDRTKMSPALAVTVDLHAAGASCGAKVHFDRAAEKGDERTLFLLRQWTQPLYRGHFRRQDVLACIHEGSLTKTITAIEDRLRAQKKLH